MFALVAAGCGDDATTGDGGARDAGAADSSRTVDGGPCARPDGDGDGHRSIACGGDDCDDADAMRHPGAAEICDAADLDEDCDPTTFGVRDDDMDGAHDGLCCNVAGDGARTCGGDCDDSRADAHPSAPEVCDERDNDCDEEIDETPPMTFYLDGDGDGFGVDGTGVAGCALPDGYAVEAGDCDDSEGGINPGVPENGCNGDDDDCDGTTDEGGTTATCSVDPDGDGYAAVGAPRMTRMCDCIAGETSRVPDSVETIDCLEGPASGASSVHPRAIEACNGRDDDCAAGPDDTFECVEGTTRAAAASCPGFSIPCVRECMDGSCALEPTCDATTTSWTWNAADPGMGHLCGGACFGTAWCAFGPCAALQYGPYVNLPAGNYEVTFDVRADVCVELAFDVVTDMGATILAGPTHHASWPPEMLDHLYTLPFTVTSPCHPVEFRISYVASPSTMGGCPAFESGPDGVAIRSTTLRLLSPVTPD